MTPTTDCPFGWTTPLNPAHIRPIALTSTLNTVGGVAQWSECRSLTGELSMIYG